MRQAADILASPAAMQIRQLEALQVMAKTANSKVVFVPMQLQSDVVGKMAAAASGSGSHGQLENVSDEGSNGMGMGSIGQTALLNSVANI